MSRSFPSLQSLRHVHVLGVCGTLMGNFAVMLKRRGMRVTGSDQNVYPPMSDVLAKAGVELCSGYAAENLKKVGQPDLVVIGNVIRKVNPEAMAVIDQDLPYCSLPEFMEQLFLAQTTNIVCAGTHGKTTTSSLMTHVLRSNGQKPSWFIGGVVQDLPDSFHVDELKPGQSFVLEGDEYDTAYWDKVPKFNHYLPDHVILTSVEYDHADIYPDMEAVLKAFRGLIDRIRPGGHLIACKDYPHVKEMIERAHSRKIRVSTYSASDSNADYFLKDLKIESGVSSFDNGKGERISVNLSGRFNALNALAVWIEARDLGLASADIVQALKSFKGVKRRQEVRGEPRGVTVIDDFAHHPTAVAETLQGLRLKYPGRRLLAVYEPRSATSRRAVFQQQYVEAFSAADQVLISVPHDTSEIDRSQRFDSDQLVEDLRGRGVQAEGFAEVSQGVRRLAESAKKGDVLVIMSNGGFGGFIPLLLAQLDSQRD